MILSVHGVYCAPKSKRDFLASVSWIHCNESVQNATLVMLWQQNLWWVVIPWNVNVKTNWCYIWRSSLSLFQTLHHVASFQVMPVFSAFDGTTNGRSSLTFFQDLPLAGRFFFHMWGVTLVLSPATPPLSFAHSETPDFGPKVSLFGVWRLN